MLNYELVLQSQSWVIIVTIQYLLLRVPWQAWQTTSSYLTQVWLLLCPLWISSFIVNSPLLQDYHKQSWHSWGFILRFKKWIFCDIWQILKIKHVYVIYITYVIYHYIWTTLQGCRWKVKMTLWLNYIFVILQRYINIFITFFNFVFFFVLLKLCLPCYLKCNWPTLLRDSMY